MGKLAQGKKWVALGAAVVVAGGLLAGAAAYHNNGSSLPVAEEEEEASRVAPVETQTPYIGNIRVTGEFIGTVEPDQQVTVIPKAMGEVLAVYKSVGDTVEAGEALLDIDSSTLRNSIAQTQAGLSSAEALARLGLTAAEREKELYNTNIEDGYNATLVEAEARVRSAEAALDTAHANLIAARRVWREARDGKSDIYVTDEQVNALRDQATQAELGVEQAQLGLEQAKLGLEVAQKGLNDNKASVDDGVTKAQIDADLTQQYLALQQMQDNLSDYTVTSPISGVIEQRNIEPYGMASQSAPVFVISNKDVMTISFQITEASYAHVRTGDRITVEKNGNTYNGTVIEISTMVDAGGMFTVKASVENPPSDLYTGSSVKVYADIQKADSTLLIPLDAVYYDNGAPYVYVARNGFAERVDIVAGIYDGEQIEVQSGLSLSDQIIVTWHSYLADGAEILIAGSVGAEPSGNTPAEDAGEEPEDGGDSAEEAPESGEEGGEDEDAPGDADSGEESLPGEEEAAE